MCRIKKKSIESRKIILIDSCIQHVALESLTYKLYKYILTLTLRSLVHNRVEKLL